ncbi:hypothetical protein AB833_28115 [Chromatiales bacterium (ex Bugula neritina AB1)]|nr:hypothetical protein AB833_28115 [Chromatiales bacterium (ex Bugula neritina AB1)]
MTKEIPLSGGNTTQGIVRLGSTVLRPQKPHSHSVHCLLQHLEAQSFGSSPRFLGTDESNREVLSFIEGSSRQPDNFYSNTGLLLKIARLLRDYHNAAANFDFSGLEWAYSYPDNTRHEIICHNDFAPYNMVFQPNDAISIIDFDLAGPGPKLRDIAYAAYWTVPLAFRAQDLVSKAQADLADGSRRLKLFCNEYGVEADCALLDMVSEVLHHMADKEAVAELLDPVVAESLEEGGHFAHWNAEAGAFDGVRERLGENL